MTERSIEEGVRYNPNIRIGRPDLRPAEGLLFANGDKKILIKMLDGDHISVTEIRGETRGIPDILEFPSEKEKYQHEIADGKVIFVYGGELNTDGSRTVTYTVPRDIDVKKSIPAIRRKR